MDKFNRTNFSRKKPIFEFQIPFWIPSDEYLKVIQISKNEAKIQNFCIAKKYNISFIYKDLQRFEQEKNMKLCPVPK